MGSAEREDEVGENEKPLTSRSLEEMEKIHISRVLEATQWHKGQACEILGVSRPRLRRMIKQYSLVVPDGSEEMD